MTIRSILVSASGETLAGVTSDHTVNTGFWLARELGAHVDALHAKIDPKSQIPLLGEGMSAGMIEEMIKISEVESQKRCAHARDGFEAAVSKFNSMVVSNPSEEGFTASWLEENGREDEVLAWRGRLSDLVVVGRPTKHSDVSRTVSLNAALFETGRPVLVVPPNDEAGDEINLGKNIAISWNDSAQSSRAVAAAMPLIRRAEQVTVFTVGSSKTSSARATELGSYLKWHGIATNISALNDEDGNVGENLLRAVANVGADLLVMGAYTHSRMRQLILGGVTRHVLENSLVPLFMSH